jgi:hypothetical protein
VLQKSQKAPQLIFRQSTNAASNPLPESPVSLARGGVVPHIIIRSPRLRLGEFEAHVLKRLLQHDLHEPEVDPAAPDVCYQG